MKALNSIDLIDLRAWLMEHGLDINDVREAVIRVDRRERERVSAWLDATVYLLDVDGKRFLDEAGEWLATAQKSVPLRSWPRLTPAPVRATTTSEIDVLELGARAAVALHRENRR